ncbi:MAG: DNA cytosine methyltransferase [Pseudomonadota bacterium]
MFDFYEFFAGGGMARAGLGHNWNCLFANDIDQKKGRIYAENWGADSLRLCSVNELMVDDLPGIPHLAWGSFPCQDLSLAGGGAGLKGDRSGTFWPFWGLMTGLAADGRAPKLIVLENVCGTLTSHGGKDFAAIGAALHKAGYKFGALVVDAAYFVPQSRPRLFIIGVHRDQALPKELVSGGPSKAWHSTALRKAHDALPKNARRSWLWWNLPEPPIRNSRFADLVEEKPSSVKWNTAVQTKKLLGMMSEVNLQKVWDAKQAGRTMVGCVYKRTRKDSNGQKVQRAEVRFDDVAGCLRTPAGGSSRQLLLVVNGNSVKSRLISSRETARLMGLSDRYRLPENYNEAYHLTGDGVVVPVVRYLADQILEPILKAGQGAKISEAA